MERGRRVSASSNTDVFIPVTVRHRHRISLKCHEVIDGQLVALLPPAGNHCEDSADSKQRAANNERPHPPRVAVILLLLLLATRPHLRRLRRRRLHTRTRRVRVRTACRAGTHTAGGVGARTRRGRAIRNTRNLLVGRVLALAHVVVHRARVGVGVGAGLGVGRAGRHAVVGLALVEVAVHDGPADVLRVVGRARAEEVAVCLHVGVRAHLVRAARILLALAGLPAVGRPAHLLHAVRAHAHEILQAVGRRVRVPARLHHLRVPVPRARAPDASWLTLVADGHRPADVPHQPERTGALEVARLQPAAVRAHLSRVARLALALVRAARRPRSRRSRSVVRALAHKVMHAVHGLLRVHTLLLRAARLRGALVLRASSGSVHLRDRRVVLAAANEVVPNIARCVRVVARLVVPARVRDVQTLVVDTLRTGRRRLHAVLARAREVQQRRQRLHRVLALLVVSARHAQALILVARRGTARSRLRRILRTRAHKVQQLVTPRVGVFARLCSARTGVALVLDTLRNSSTSCDNSIRTRASVVLLAGNRRH
eukprot:Rhum_TRINITY_DN15355_c0_g1::Rhum_TRINITY_DN15355_c0_g1_i2::g.151640::m.151640